MPPLGSTNAVIDTTNNNADWRPKIGIAQVARRTVLVTQGNYENRQCEISGLPNGLDFNGDGTGGTSPVSFTARIRIDDTHCGWRLTVSHPWIHVSGPVAGVGGGTFSVTVDRNFGTTTRSGLIMINGEEFWIEQYPDNSATCTFSVSPTEVGVPATEADPVRRIDVTTQPNCGWDAASLSPQFLSVIETVYSGSGTGNGWVRVLVSNNPQGSPAREGTVLVAGRLVTFHQAAWAPSGEGGPGDPLAEPVDTKLSFYHVDAIGSVRLITDDSGVPIARYNFMPDGQQVTGVSEEPFNRVRFGGKERDLETKTPALDALDYLGARYYQSQTGRFTSPDPITVNALRVVNPQRWNRYAYAVNNPLKYVDPDGLDAWRAGTVLVAGRLVTFHQAAWAPSGEGGPGDPLAEPVDTKLSFYHVDAIGSVRLITNETGTPIARYNFTPDGQQTTGANEEPLNRVRFGGKERDLETKTPALDALDYLGARYYQSQTGRFTSPDIPGIDQNPFDSQSWNLYSYVRNNPLKYTDPTGLKCENGYNPETGAFCTETIGEDPYRRANEAWLFAQQFFLDSLFNHLLTPKVVDFSAGLGDALLLGTGPYFRRQLEIDVVDRCSSAYSAGAWSSFAFGAARVGYAGLAKGASIFASSGAQASAFRQGLKSAARLGVASSWRQPNLAKYGTDEALRAAAGRTNPVVNAWGAGTAVAGAAGAMGCGR